ncbi:hypothetical protein RBB77_02435 [Tunturibacter psychrotolerans]|uniref:Uncharacterized protein n=1 Tax=Tunturiibacter psychrotolerans TaxID=3069686 RepID=A0AAU7ZS45_9BACT
MRSMRISIAAMALLAADVCAPQSPNAQLPTPDSPSLENRQLAAPPTAGSSSNTPLYRELDLLRRGGFFEAPEARVSLKIVGKDGVPPSRIETTEYALIVNGTPRIGRLQAPKKSTDAVSPLVLLVFPPNQPVVHAIGVREATKYFASQPTEVLPWRVGIFDSNGKLTPFTNGRSQLLVNLGFVSHAVEPFQYTGDRSMVGSQPAGGSWLVKAEDAVSLMQRFDGPKVVLAMNPLAESMYGLNDQMFAHDGPEALVDVAKHVGAHIYVANVGGPEAFVPAGGAAEDRPAQMNVPSSNGGPQLGTAPSMHMKFDPRLNNALANSAARTSLMMQTADSTLGGFANSLDALAAQLHRDLDETYSLNFDMTAADRDHGVPTVEVKFADHNLRASIMEVSPVGTTSEANREAVSKVLVDKVRKATIKPVSSTDFRITQHVDYFPLRSGLEPLLPMSALVEWTGVGRGPARLSVVESVDDVNLSTPLMERAAQVRWDGHHVSWERDGNLHPGQYLWRIAVHDGNGTVFASAEQKINVSLPRETSVEVSSLVIGKSCREQVGSVDGLRRRTTDNHDDVPPVSQIDPMRAVDCRIKPEASDRFASTDRLHAFVRIYPSEKIDKHKPESWTAKFTLRSRTNPVATEKETPFRVDSGSGYLAYIEMSLDTPGMDPGQYTLDVVTRGPGIRKELKESRSISIQQPVSNHETDAEGARKATN